jgi:hypothetical protein
MLIEAVHDGLAPEEGEVMDSAASPHFKSPSAWRGLPSPPASLAKNVVREFREHPLQTIAFLAAAAAIARLALKPKKTAPTEVSSAS